MKEKENHNYMQQCMGPPYFKKFTNLCKKVINLIQEFKIFKNLFEKFKNLNFF